MSSSNTATTNVDPTNTAASSNGVLPTSVALILLIIISGAALALGRTLGYPTRLLGVLLAAGALSALGVRTAVKPQLTYVTLGVTILWAGALTFTVGTALLVTQAGSIGIALVAAAATTLAPFSILGNTIRRYGEGAGNAALRQYTLGTVILSLGIGVLVAGNSVQTTVMPAIDAAVSGIGTGLVATGSWANVLFGVLIYAIFSYTVNKAAHTLPFDPLVSIQSAGALETARERIGKVHSYAWRGLVLYAVANVALFYYVENAANATQVERVITAVHAPMATPALLLVGSITAGLLVVSGVVRAAQRFAGLTVAGITKTVTPPGVLLAASYAALTAFSSEATGRLLESPIGQQLSEGSLIYSLVTASPPVIVLAVLPAGLLYGAFVFSIPSMVAGVEKGDASLAGVTSGALSLAVIVLLTVITDQTSLVIIAGVATVAIVWEIGEYATVAAGELTAPTSSSHTAPGFGKLTTVHSTITLIVSLVAVGVTFAVVSTVGTLAISDALLTAALILCSAALVLIFILLSG